MVLGLSGAANAGDAAIVVANERKVREIVDERKSKSRDTRFASQQASKLEDAFSKMGGNVAETVNVMIKADVQGSAEALKDSLEKLSTDEVRVKIVMSAVGGINESDVNLAEASKAVMIGFNVRADGAAKRTASDIGVEIRYYSIIYEAIDDVKLAMSGLLKPELREEIIGLAEVKDVFRSSKMGAVAGTQVLEGMIKRGSPIRVLRDNVVVFEGELESLRRHKDNVNEVKSGTECGIAVKNYDDVQPGDQIEVYERTEIARTI
jgi:translation initiation factor IF-2